MSKQWLKQLLTYINKVYNIGELIKRAKDSRIKPQITTQAVFFTILMGFLFRMKSSNVLNHWIRMKRFNKLITRKFRLPYVDTIRRSLSGWDMPQQKRSHHELKGSWHIDHCFEHNAVALEAIFYMCIMGFNLFQLFIFRCIHH
jgi:hypothetical protein